MFLDHRGGRTRIVYEVGDIAKYRPIFILAGLPFSSYGLRLKEHQINLKDFSEIEKSIKDDKTKESGPVVLDKIIDCGAQVTIKRQFLYDPRKTQDLDLNRYIVSWEGSFFFVGEYDLNMLIVGGYK